jgi:hypothetical protein
MKKHLAIIILAVTCLLFGSCNREKPAARDYAAESAAALQTYTEALKTVAETLPDAAVSSGGNTSLSSAGWEQALDDYEEFVDEYVAFMREYSANPGDMAMLGKYASMMTQAQTAMDSMSNTEAELSGADLAKFSERYLKLAAKMATAIQY